MAGTGFIDNLPSVDDDTPAPPPVKRQKAEPLSETEHPKINAWGEEIQEPPFDTEGLSIEQIEALEAEHSSINQAWIADAKPEGYSGEGSSPAEFPVVVERGMDGLASGFAALGTSGNDGLSAVERAKIQPTTFGTGGAHVCVGIAGPPKSGKSSIFFDSISADEAKSGAWGWHVDFDGFGRASVLTNYPHLADNIIHPNPYVLFDKATRVAYDFPKTHINVIEILQDALKQVDAQDEYFAEHGKKPDLWLKSICLDGAGKFLKICELCMKIVDLDLGPDAIAVAGQRISQEVGWGNWYIRTNYYESMLELIKQLSRRGVHCYLIAHLKEKHVKREPTGVFEPDWLGGKTEAAMTQTIRMDIEDERDEDTGQETGVRRSWATLQSNGLSLKTPGRVLIYQQDKTGGEWFGWPGLRVGDFAGTHDDENADS